MSNTTSTLQRKLSSAKDLQAVVRTMKAVSMASIGQYESAVRSLDRYLEAVNLGLAACFRQTKSFKAPQKVKVETATVVAIIFGSDQGLVGKFNEIAAKFALATLKPLSTHKSIWTVGERMHAQLSDTGIEIAQTFELPSSIANIKHLVGDILTKLMKESEAGNIEQVYLFHNQPLAATVFTAKGLQLLPLDEKWQQKLSRSKWPTYQLPEILNNHQHTLSTFIHEYLFVSLFRCCAESLASENATRLAAMQRADENIERILKDLNQRFYKLRQDEIDEELFDVVSAFEAVIRSNSNA